MIELRCPLCRRFIGAVQEPAGMTIEFPPCKCGVKTTVELTRDSALIKPPQRGQDGDAG